MAIKEVLHTDLAPAAVGPYSQAIAANGFVFTSGQVPIDPKAGKIVATTIEEQTEQVMKTCSAFWHRAACPLTVLSRPPASCPTSTTLLHSTACTRSTSRKALRLVPALK